jgi:hypothetical protein
MAENDDRVSLAPLKPTQALKALLSVEPSDETGRCSKTWEGKRCSLQPGHRGPCRFDTPN